jgi:saccharopepsin
MNTKTFAGEGVSLPLYRGPFQNNGASPWYAELQVGTPEPGAAPQFLKFSLDTGSDFVWVTSSLCPEDSCHHWGGLRFDIAASTSFKMIKKIPCECDFGPWGTMNVDKGNDIIHFGDVQITTDIYVTTDYQGSQFRELNWDGGIGLPSTGVSISTSAVAGERKIKGVPPCDPTPFVSIFKMMLQQGDVSADMPYIAFNTNDASPTPSGVATLGQLDPTFENSLEYLFLPWADFGAVFPSVSYIWTSKLSVIEMAGVTLGTPQDQLYFGLDSGSSQFKGDDDIMRIALNLAENNKDAELKLILDLGEGNGKGELVIPPNIFNVEIEEGSSKGETVPQFAGLGIKQLVLVGSVLMDSLYTVFEYKIERRGDDFQLSPKGMWIFNKPSGPRIIQNRHNKPAALYHKSPKPKSQALAQVNGEWTNDFGSVVNLSVDDNGLLTGTYGSTTGSSGTYYIVGNAAPISTDQDQGINMAICVFWRPIDALSATPDPSWHWSTTQSGQLMRDGTLSLVQSLLATTDFPGLASFGNYVQQLTYKRSQIMPVGNAMPPPATDAPQMDNPINGYWQTADGLVALTLSVKETRQGWVCGWLQYNDSMIALNGFTDIYADAASLQSLTMTGYCAKSLVVIALNGSFDPASNSLTLSRWLSRSTSKDNEYVQTAVDAWQLSRK